MTVIEIGDLRTANGVKCGIVIAAQKEELQEIAGKILYREVTVEPIKENPAEIWDKKMEEMCEKLIEIDQRLREQKNTKKYTRDEVLAMLDEIDPSEHGEGVSE